MSNLILGLSIEQWTVIGVVITVMSLLYTIWWNSKKKEKKEFKKSPIKQNIGKTGRDGYQIGKVDHIGDKIVFAKTKNKTRKKEKIRI